MNGFANTLKGFGRTLKEIHVIIALSIALLAGGCFAVLSGTAAGAVGFVATSLILRGLTPLVKMWIKPEMPDGKRRLLATILAVPLMILCMCVPVLALRLTQSHLVPAVMNAQSFSFALLLGVFISLSSIKHT